MKITLFALLFLSLPALANDHPRVRILDGGYDNSKILYACNNSDRLVTLTANAAIAQEPDGFIKQAKIVASLLMYTDAEFNNYLEALRQNRDVAYQLAYGINNTQNCVLAPNKWLMTYDRMKKAGKI